MTLKFLFEFPRWMSSPFTFPLRLFTTYASCLLTCSTWTLCFSLCLLLRLHHHTCGWLLQNLGVVNRDLWYARRTADPWRSRRDASLHVACFNTVLFSLTKLVFIFCYSHSLNLDFPTIGLSLLNFIWKLCLLAFSSVYKVMRKMLKKKSSIL